ncbi:hypothetical protein K8R66_00815 [bacterium]|nr:hypothetical protein [bacterium]
MEMKETLQQFGLNNKEIKLYLASLSSGIASITQLSKKAGLKRPTTYLIIDELLKKNLLISIPKGKKTFYKAENPKKLIEKLEEKKKNMEKILPELKSIYITNSKRPKVRFYEGKDQITKMYEEMFRTEELWGMYSIKKLSKIYTQEENGHFFRILARQGGMIYDMAEDTKHAREYTKINYRKGCGETKFLPPKIQVPTDILVSKNKLSMISFKNLIGVVIEEENIVKTHQMLLQFIWNSISNN